MCGRGGRAVMLVRVFEPLGQQRLQLAHVLEGQIEGLEPGNGGLGEVVAVHLAHGEADVPLRVSELNPLLLEQFRKSFQLLKIGVLFWRKVKSLWQWHGWAGGSASSRRG